MKTIRWEKAREIRDYTNLTEVEGAINSLFAEMFREMKYRNMVVETDTVAMNLAQVTQEITKKAYNPNKAVMKVRCVMREATGRGYVPQNIFKNGRNTTVKWEDGTVTTVKLAEGEKDCDYTAFTAALAIKILGNNSRVGKIVREKLVIQKKKGEKKDA